MQFYDFRTTRDWTQQNEGVKNIDADEFYGNHFAFAMRQGWAASANQMFLEHTWERNRRPYYNVYPSILPMLLRLNLALDTEFVTLPVPVFSIRLPQEPHALSFPDNGSDYSIRAMLVGHSTGLRNAGNVYPGLVIWMDTGEREQSAKGLPVPIHTYINLPLSDDMTLEDAIHALPYDTTVFHGMRLPEEIRTACVRLVCTLCLLDNDPSLIEPDVLNRDTGKPLSEQIIDRAKRRGKYGWNVGKGIEVIPHVRRPHPAVMWTGHGRTSPRIVLRKGSVVHRDTIMRLPSGYSPEPEEIKDGE